MEQKAQLDKATADAAEFKAGYDKLTVDAVEQKAVFDKLTADAAEYKAGFDKALLDNVEQKAQLDKATADAAEFKAGYDKAAVDMTRLAADMTTAQEALLKEREALSTLQDQHELLLRQQEVLQAELSVALGSYRPRAVIDAGTPADKLLAMMTELLDGGLPNLQDILLVQSTILEARDIYQPFRLGKQLMESAALGPDVGMNLIHLLGDTESILKERNARLAGGGEAGGEVGGGAGAGVGAEGDGSSAAVSLEELCARRERRWAGGSGGGSKATESSSEADGSEQQQQAEPTSFPTLQAALSAILTAANARALGRPAGSVAAAEAGSSCGASASGAATPATRASARMHGAAMRSKSVSGPGALRAPLPAAPPLAPAPGPGHRVRRGSASSAVVAGADGGRLTLLPSAVGGEEEIAEWLASAGSDSAAATAAVAAAAAAAGPQQQQQQQQGQQQQPLAPPAPALLDKVERLLAASQDWQWDAFALADATQGRPLSTLAFFLCQRDGLVAHFGLNAVRLARFLRRVEEGYRANPYHNATHAADVLQSLATIVHRGGMATAYVDPLHLLACYTAAAVHDFEHGGLTNDFLVSSGDALAVTYNDR